MVLFPPVANVPLFFLSFFFLILLPLETVEALLSEALRMGAPVPLSEWYFWWTWRPCLIAFPSLTNVIITCWCIGLPHRLMEDDHYRGMYIPKGSLVSMRPFSFELELHGTEMTWAWCCFSTLMIDFPGFRKCLVSSFVAGAYIYMHGHWSLIIDHCCCKVNSTWRATVPSSNRIQSRSVFGSCRAGGCSSERPKTVYFRFRPQVGYIL